MTYHQSARLSEDGVYRYELRREWTLGGTLVNFVMLNPSTADAERDDPTIRRCIGFANSWGYGGIVVTNLYALRATQPARLWTVPDPVGPENDSHLADAARHNVVVAAWGVNAKADRISAFLHLIPNTVWTLGLTKGGHPRHPLYVSAATQPVIFRGIAAQTLLDKP